MTDDKQKLPGVSRRLSPLFARPVTKQLINTIGTLTQRWGSIRFIPES